jgi:hypothetical protein
MNKSFLAGLVLTLASSVATAQSAKLTWAPVTQYDTGIAITLPVSYNIYQGARGQAVKTKVSASTATTVSLTAALFAGKEVCWNITAVVETDESVYSNEACKTFPKAVPKAPATLVAE